MRRGRRTAGLAALFTVGTLAMLQPSPHELTQTLPANLGDPALITWILHWGWHALTTAPVHYFAANIFWPHPSPLAYSDLLTPLTPVYGMVYSLTGNWALALNTTLVAAFIGSLAAAYGFVKWLTARTDAAVLSAFAFTFTGFSLSEWGHIQLATLGLLPLGLWLTGLVLERRKLRHAVLLGVVSAAIPLAAVYYGVLWFVVLAVVVAGYWLVRRGRPGPGFVRCFAVAGVVAAVLAGPAAYKYLQLQKTEGHKRAYEPTFSLKARDLVTPANDSYVWESLLEPSNGAQLQEHGLYPGFTVVLLAGVGAVTLLRRPRPSRVSTGTVPVETRGGGGGRGVMVGLTAAAGAVALVLAIGPTALGHAMPYRFFHDHVPGFAGIRVTARFFVMTALALSVFAGIGLAALNRKGRWTVAAAALVLVCVDLAAPLSWAHLPDDPGTLAVYKALSRGPDGAVVELPMGDPRLSAGGWAYVESPRMIHSTLDWNPRVNGYSGFAPSSYFVDIDAFAKLPAPEGFAHARTLRVRYLVLHVGDEQGFPAFTEAAAQQIVDARPAGATAARYGRSWLIDLGPAGA
jgi:hypothetical protein